jgi:hypothetical protein
METTEQIKIRSEYSEKWKERFEFFDVYGAPSSKSFKTAVKGLSFKKKILICQNFMAFFFGFIYLFVLGLWKRNLAMLGVVTLMYIAFIVGFALMGMQFPATVERGLGIGVSIWYGTSVNYAYYLKEVKGYNGWNPFKY